MNPSRHIVLRRPIAFVVSNAPTLSLPHRYVSTDASDEQLGPWVPWDTSWLESELGLENDVVLPQNKSVSRKSGSRESLDQGVTIGKRGQLKVISRAAAVKQGRTALIVSAASTHLTKADFTRLVPGNDEQGPHGLEAVIPGRHFKTLDRLPYWILLFRTPLFAAAYQSHLQRYHQNAVKNQPVNPLQAALTPGRGLTPPPGYIDPETGEDVWKQLREYTILQPTQDFSVTALLPRFPPSIDREIELDKKWNGPSEDRRWTVRIRVDGLQLDEKRIFQFLEEDAKARKRPWAILRSGCNKAHGQLQCAPAVFEENSRFSQLEGLQNFIVRFHSEEEAMKFWRTWHRKPFRDLAENATGSDCHSPLLHVELAW